MLEPKLKQDEPMDTSEIPCEGKNEEEGEISSDDGEVFWTQAKSLGQRILGDSTSYGLPPSSIQELKKLSRAQRFGIPIDYGRTALVDTGLMTRLYKSLGINEDNEKHYRFNAVHMRGTQNMSTGDVYEYFTLFKPSYIEWINDISCNIVWTDHFSAAKALLNLSKEIKNLDKIRFNANPFKKELELSAKEMVPNVDADAIDAREIEGAIPPGYWRIGVPAKKSRTILLRLATRSDKKQRFAEKNSEYYRKYGNPHFGNIPGIVSNSLRSEVFKNYKQGSNNQSENMKDKNKKNPWGNLAEEWGKQDEDMDARCKIQWIREGPPLRTDLRLSLNNKQADKPKNLMGYNFESSQSENDRAKDKFPKMKMYADEEGELKITTVNAKEFLQGYTPYVEDLRQRINRSRKRKQLMEEELKHKRMRYWSRHTHEKSGDFDDDGEHIGTKITVGVVKKFDNGEVEYDDYYDPDDGDSDDDDDDDSDDGSSDDDDDDDDDDDSDDDDGVVDDASVKIDVGIDDDDNEDEEKGSSWALENYSHLRKSLAQGKKYKKSGNAKKHKKSKSKAKGKDGNNYNTEDDIYKMDIHHRSPLQIEFENDDYFEKEST